MLVTCMIKSKVSMAYYLYLLSHQPLLLESLFLFLFPLFLQLFIFLLCG